MVPRDAGAQPLGTAEKSGGLAEVERVRQYFPETWIWAETLTDSGGRATLEYEAPDSITTWDLRAVALSPRHGLGVAEASVTVFQPFFLQADLPYSVIRGEEFPVKIALYNYLNLFNLRPQTAELIPHRAAHSSTLVKEFGQLWQGKDSFEFFRSQRYLYEKILGLTFCD